MSAVGSSFRYGWRDVSLTIDTTVYQGALSTAMGGADTSIIASFLVGAGLYYILARQQLHHETSLLDTMDLTDSGKAAPLSDPLLAKDVRA
jgi:hypothetical protein